MKKFLIFVFILFFCNVYGQIDSLNQLYDELLKGNKKTLFELAKYFDNQKITILKDWHRTEITDSQRSRGIAETFCLFTENEFIFSDSTSTKTFLEFLTQNHDKIIYSDLVHAFLITPLKERNLDFELMNYLKEREKS